MFAAAVSTIFEEEKSFCIREATSPLTFSPMSLPNRSRIMSQRLSSLGNPSNSGVVISMNKERTYLP